ncbi:MAG TPA: PEGA domain-containing protein [Sorangium sp.]|uniref:PEGA domain-containing protein n=1 Tax=Sorangium sp. So ce1153 TaxID=3133333 RepID=UPI002B5A8B1B|nr:PEGA domain-containing protein [Sorangium sp.]
MELTPEETTELEQAAVRLNEVLARIVSLEVATVPEGAQVTVDGCVRGRTPLLYPVFLEPGPHLIRAALEGYMPTRHVIETTAGETLGLTVHLRPSHTEVPATMDAPGEGGAACGEPRRRGVGALME